MLFHLQQGKLETKKKEQRVLCINRFFIAKRFEHHTWA